MRLVRDKLYIYDSEFKPRYKSNQANSVNIATTSSQNKLQPRYQSDKRRQGNNQDSHTSEPQRTRIFTSRGRHTDISRRDKSSDVTPLSKRFSSLADRSDDDYALQRESRKQMARSPLENESNLKKYHDCAQVEQSLSFFSQKPMELHTTVSERPTCKSPEVNSAVIKDGPVVTLTLGNTTNIQPTGKVSTQ